LLKPRPNKQVQSQHYELSENSPTAPEKEAAKTLDPPVGEMGWNGMGRTNTRFSPIMIRTVQLP